VTAADALTCETVAARELVERYVTGRLTDADGLGEFEVHVLTCARCREEVRLALAVRAELRAAAAPHARRWPIGVSLAVAAGAAALLLLRPSTARLQALGAVQDAPIYLGEQVRGGAPTAADSIFDQAMRAYANGDYAGAAAGLDRALKAGVDSAPALFFLGVSELLLHRDGDAASGLRRAVALGDTPYLLEARYYLAKALLRGGDGRGALRELSGTGPDSAVAAANAALADSVRSMIER